MKPTSILILALIAVFGLASCVSAIPQRQMVDEETGAPYYYTGVVEEETGKQIVSTEKVDPETGIEREPVMEHDAEAVAIVGQKVVATGRGIIPSPFGDIFAGVATAAILGLGWFLKQSNKKKRAMLKVATEIVKSIESAKSEDGQTVDMEKVSQPPDAEAFVATVVGTEG